MSDEQSGKGNKDYTSTWSIKDTLGRNVARRVGEHQGRSNHRGTELSASRRLSRKRDRDNDIPQGPTVAEINMMKDDLGPNYKIYKDQGMSDADIYNGPYSSYMD